jgi:tRNA-uridine 2-sulfurtransferase
MSGGVDSSVAAGLLLRQGHEVVGATLKLWGGASDAGCCSVADVDDARRVAQTLGIDHHVFNYTEEFERSVVDPFVVAHSVASTPNPCVACNRYVKFDLLTDRAARLGFDAVATGHHARVERVDGRWALRRGVDFPKDQSYVLGFLTEAQLSRLVMPIGNLTKADVRTVAAELGLRTWNKPDSQDTCFIEAADRKKFLSQRIALTGAAVIDRASGLQLGTTTAAELMTVGQRRHVGVGPDGERRYVARVDLARRRVEVDRLEAVMTMTVTMAPHSLIFARALDAGGERFLAQRSAHGPADAATLRGESIHFDDPVRPVAPGQVVVLYRERDPDTVEGAGVAAAP